MSEQDERRSRRQYSDQDIAEALTVLQANEGNISRTARQLDVPEATLRYWNEVKAVAIGADRIRELRARKTEGLAEAFHDLAWECIGSVTKEKLDRASLKDTSIAAAVATDKARLLKGEPTQLHAAVEARKTVAAIVARTGLSEKRAREIVAAQLGISVEELLTSDDVM